MLELEFETALESDQGRPSLCPVSIERGAAASLARVPRERTRPPAVGATHARVTARSGRTVLLVCLGLALLAGVVALAFAIAGGKAGDGAAGPVVPRKPAAPVLGPPPTPDAPRAEAPRTSATADVPQPKVSDEDLRLRVDALRAKQTDEERFRGRGRIRGFVDTADASPFPTVWSLVLEPSTTLVGSERAARRVIEFTAGEQEFVVDDLPLAGYDVLASAPGWNARRHTVLLDNRHKDPYITMQIYATGFVEGRVLDHEHLPAAGLAVTLRWLSGEEEARETTCDVLGRYRFDDVLDGEYELKFGAVLSPLIPAARLRFSAPSMTMPDRVLPVTSTVKILALDGFGNPVSDVRVRGSGSNGGTFDVVTDAVGVAEARFLAPGRYRISGEHELYLRARQACELSETPADVVLRLQPSR